MENKEEKKAPPSEKEMLEAVKESKNQFDSAETAVKEYRDDENFSWDDRANLFRGIYKNPKEKTESIFSTGELTSLAIDGSCRVMAQMPSGRFYNYTGNVGANMLMNLLFEHHVIPNANSGGPMLLKFRMANLWSRVFPKIPMFIDWTVDRNGYTGPNPIVIHPRRFRLQAGKTSIEDAEYCFIDTDVSVEWLKTRNKKYWRNIEEVLSHVGKEEEGSGASDQEVDPKKKGKKRTGIVIRHKLYANGDYLVYFPEKELPMFFEKNYFPGIPVSLKGQYPVIDDFNDINDFDRGHVNQKAIDTISRLYLDGVAMSIKPPLVMDPDQVVLSSVVRKPDTNWFVKNGNYGAIKPQSVSPQGFQTFEAVYGILKANLMSLGASTDTSISSSVDPGFGKTPEALKMQGERQGARDLWDSYQQEQFVEKTYTIMADMIGMKGLGKFTGHLFGTSIEKIKEQYPDEDIDKLIGFKKEQNTFEMEAKKLHGKYRYILDSGSIGMKKDDTGEKIFNLLKLFAENPEIKQSLEQSGKKVDFGEAFKRIVLDQGIQDGEKIIVDAGDPESIDGIGDDEKTIDQEQVQVDAPTEEQLIQEVQEQQLNQQQ